MSDALLSVDGLSVAYGSAGRALDGINLHVPREGIVAVIGRNGAGKTTLARVITGTAHYYGGRILSGTATYAGAPLRLEGRRARGRRGIAHVPEGRRILGQLTVEDNLRSGAIAAGRDATRKFALADIYELFPVLGERAKQRAGYLSGGEQQMLAIGRALAAGPELLILDEPSLGLAPAITERIGEVLRELSARGMAILLVEQNAALALTLATQVEVLDVGRVVASGTPEQLGGVETVASRYLGTAAGAAAEPAARRRVPTPAAPPRAVLEVDGVSAAFGALRVLDDVSLSVGRGELVAVIGPNGAGKSSLLNCISQIIRWSGEIRYAGDSLRHVSEEQLARRAVGRTFQHVHAPAAQTVENVVMVGRERVLRGGMFSAALGVHRRSETPHRRVVAELLESLGIAAYAGHQIKHCPYGVQKRVDLARALAMEPDLLLADEPFAGLHYDEGREIIERINAARRERDVAVLLVDHNVNLVLGAADRVIVLDGGRTIAAGTPDEIRVHPAVIEAYLGRGADDNRDERTEAVTR